MMNSAVEEEKFNIVGLVVNTRIDHQDNIVPIITSIKGVEICASEAGKLVITIDDYECDATVVDTITEINNIPGVIATSIAYHYFEGGLEGKEKHQ